MCGLLDLKNADAMRAAEQVYRDTYLLLFAFHTCGKHCRRNEHCGEVCGGCCVTHHTCKHTALSYCTLLAVNSKPLLQLQALANGQPIDGNNQGIEESSSDSDSSSEGKASFPV